MLHAAVQRHLIGKARLGENVLGLVALGGGEDAVGLGGGDGEGGADCGEFFDLKRKDVKRDREKGPRAGPWGSTYVHETRMRHVSNVYFPLVWAEVADDVLRAETVSDGADLGAVVFRAQLDEGGVDDGVYDGGFVSWGAGQPFLEVEVRGAVERDGVLRSRYT